MDGKAGCKRGKRGHLPEHQAFGRLSQLPDFGFGSGFRVSSPGFRSSDFGYRVSRIPDLRFVLGGGFGSGIWDLRFVNLGLGFKYQEAATHTHHQAEFNLKSWDPNSNFEFVQTHNALVRKVLGLPPSSKLGTCKTVKTRFRSWISGESLRNFKGVPASFGSGSKAGSYSQLIDICITQL